MDVAHRDILPHGFRYEMYKTATPTDVRLWPGLTRQRSLDRSVSAFAQQTAFEHSVTPAPYLTGLVAAAATHLSTRLPPPSGSLVTLWVHFTTPVFVGTTVCVAVTVTAWDSIADLSWLDVRVTRTDGILAVVGSAWLRPNIPILAAA